MDEVPQLGLPDPLVTSDPELQSGVPVFSGTRVPVKNLYDYLERDLTLAEFVDDFPNVTRAHAVAVLEAARTSYFRRSSALHREAAE